MEEPGEGEELEAEAEQDASEESSLTVIQAYGHYMQQCREVCLGPELESGDDFILLRDHLFCDAAPADAIEGMLVDRLVALLWRQRRLGRLEREIFERLLARPDAAAPTEDSRALSPMLARMLDQTSSSGLDWLQRYEAQLDRSVQRVLAELRYQQHLRREREKAEAQIVEAVRADEAEAGDEPVS